MLLLDAFLQCSSSASGPFADFANFSVVDPTFDLQDFLRMPSPPYVDASLAHFPTGDTQTSGGATAALAVLLAKMSHYEAQLREQPESKLDTYPIGDALLLPARLCEILFDYGHESPTDAGPRQDPTNLLLTLSCHINVLRIYSSVFDYMGAQLSQMAKEQESAPQDEVADAAVHRTKRRRTYRRRFHVSPASSAAESLSLSQLHTICLCSICHPVEKAVSILLGTIRDAEDILKLPAELRIGGVSACDHVCEPAISGEEPPSASSRRIIRKSSEEGMVLFKEGLTNERMYMVVERLANEARGKVRKVKLLLHDLFQSHAHLPGVDIDQSS